MSNTSDLPHGAAVPAPFAAAPAAPAPAVDIVARIAAKPAARAISLAVFAGILGQLLFVGQGAGINIAIWVALMLVAAWAVRPRVARMDRADVWLPTAALAFAALIALRDDAMLFTF